MLIIIIILKALSNIINLNKDLQIQYNSTLNKYVKAVDYSILLKKFNSKQESQEFSYLNAFKVNLANFDSIKKQITDSKSSTPLLRYFKLLNLFYEFLS